MKLFSWKKTVFTSFIGLAAILGVTELANGQSNREYRDYRRAQREANREYREYQRSGSREDYREWQRAQREAQREYRDYQQDQYRAMNRANQRYYRVYRDGRYYQTDYRGAELLRQAVNSGYQQGYRQGQVDRRYGRGNDYYGDNIYRSGTYGYQSYVDRSQYQYYFREGFERGYQDGYNSQARYGYNSGGTWNILGTILNSILNLQ